MGSQMRIGTIMLGKTLDDVLNKESDFNKFNKKFSSYTCSNSLQYATEPSRDNDFDLENDDIQAKYVPTVEYTLNAINEEVFRAFIQITNTKGFFVKYYDFELGVDVIRKMYMTDESVSKLQYKAPNGNDTLGGIARLIGLSFTFVSKYAYESYEDLIEKATYTPKFMHEEVVDIEEDYLLVYNGYTTDISIFGSRYEVDTAEQKIKLLDTFTINNIPENYDKLVWYGISSDLSETKISSPVYALKNKDFTKDENNNIVRLVCTKETIQVQDYQNQ